MVSTPRHVAFLRAINVGRRRVAMADLLAAVEPLGFHDPWTHIASGNLVFGSSEEPSSLEVEGAEIHWLIEGKTMDSALEPRDWRPLGLGPTTNRNTTMLRTLASRLER